MLVERTLERRQLSVTREPFDRGDARTVRLYRQQHAALHRGAVEVDRAGATVPRVAADVRSGEPEIVPNEMDEEAAGGNVVLDRLAVHVERDRAAG